MSAEPRFFKSGADFRRWRAVPDPARSSVYSFENRGQSLDAAYEKRFRAAKKAFAFFEAQPPGYRRLCIHYVMSAKKPQTREKRLARLLADSSAARRLGELEK